MRSFAVWLILTATAIVLGVAVRSFSGQAEEVPRVRMDRHIPRVQFQSSEAGILSARDFAGFGDTLAVLDWRNSDVAILAKDSLGSWGTIRRFGRRGEGPGEFASPVALARAEDGKVAILERSGELEVYALDGDHHGMTRFRLPCMAPRPQLANTQSSFLFAAECPGGWGDRLSGDSIYLGLWRLHPYDPAVLLHAEPTMTVDGEGGSAYATPWPVAQFNGGVVFGSGLRPCVSVGGPDTGGWSFHDSCEIVGKAYSAPSPANWRPRDGAAYEWPDPLQPYVAAFSVRGRILLLRPFQADSAVLTDETGSHPALVIPLGSLVKCDSSGCLWYEAGIPKDSIAFVSASELAELTRSAAEGPLRGPDGNGRP